jgi:hypothetical protein
MGFVRAHEKVNGGEAQPGGWFDSTYLGGGIVQHRRDDALFKGRQRLGDLVFQVLTWEERGEGEINKTREGGE